MPNNTEVKKFLTTTQAAKLLSVSPDTVLKWVRAGKIKSHRTLGGHFRICIDELDIPPGADAGITGKRSKNAKPAFQYCWEHVKSIGGDKNKCMECIAYRSRARRCYELKDLPNGLGCLGLSCDTSCSDCEYYKLVIEQGVNVLVFGKKENLVKDVENLSEETDIQVKFIENEYDCALLIQEFRPDYIVVDYSLGKTRTDTLCSNILNDTRIPVARIILASKSKKMTKTCEKKVFGWIKKPFTVQQLKDCIEVPE